MVSIAFCDAGFVLEPGGRVRGNAMSAFLDAKGRRVQSNPRYQRISDVAPYQGGTLSGTPPIKGSAYPDGGARGDYPVVASLQKEITGIEILNTFQGAGTG